MQQINKYTGILNNINNYDFSLFKKFIYIGILLYISWFFVQLVTSEAYFEIGMLLILVFGFVCLLYNKYAYLLFLISVFLPIHYIERYFFEIPNIFRWLSYVLLLTAVFSIYIRYKNPINELINNVPSFVWGISIVWIIVGYISNIYNGNTHVSMIMGYRWLFIFIFSFALINAFMKKYENINIYVFLRFIVIIGIVHIPVTMFQRIVVTHILGIGAGDAVTGLFSSYTDLVYFQIFCVVVVISFWLKRQRIISIQPITTIVLLLLPLIISNARASWMFLLLSILFMLYLNGLFSSLKNIKVAFVVSILIIFGVVVFDTIMVKYYPERQDDRIAYLVDPTYIIKYNFGGSDLNELVHRVDDEFRLRRGQAIVFNTILVSLNRNNIMLGFGPGSVSHSRVPGGIGHIYEIYQNDSLDRNTVSKFIGELGISGMMLLAFLIIALYRRKSKNCNYGDTLYLIRGTTVFLIFILLFYYDVLQSFIVFLTLAVLYSTEGNSKKMKIRQF